MQKPRAKPFDVTPESEDAGLFRAGLSRVVILLIPLIRRNSRQDLVISGYVGENRAVAVVFAGRRMPAAKPLVTHLEQQRAQIRRQAAMRGQPVPDVRIMRLPVEIEGTWRKKVIRDADGWARNDYELMAAQWTIVNSRGEPTGFGAPPAITVPRTGPARA